MKILDRWLLLLLGSGVLLHSRAVAAAGSEASILKTVPWLEKVQDSADAVERIQSISVSKNASLDDNADIPFCNIAMVMPFSRFQPDRIPLENGVFKAWRRYC